MKQVPFSLMLTITTLAALKIAQFLQLRVRKDFGVFNNEAIQVPQ